MKKILNYTLGTIGALAATSAPLAILTNCGNPDAQKPGKFNGKSWSEVITAINTFEENPTPSVESAVTLAKALGVTNPSQQSDARTTLEKNLVGLEGTIVINNQEHIIKCIGAMHDRIKDSRSFAALTFELWTLVSDANGNAMYVKYDENNYDYINSSMRKCLTGNGNGTVAWYQDEETKSTETRTVWQMITESNSDLKNGIKTVNKKIAINPTKELGEDKFVVTEYSDTLFPLTCNESAYGDIYYAASEGSAYNYWSAHKGSCDERLKKPVGKSGEEVESLGYWLASPATNSTADVWSITAEATIDSNNSYQTNALSFSFCM